MLQFFLAILFLFLTTVFGASVLKETKINSDNMIASLIIGIPSLSFAIFLLSLILPLKPTYIFLLIIGISFLELRKNLLKAKFKTFKLEWGIILAIILSLVAITFYTYRQSYNNVSGLTFYTSANSHDSLWHAALQNNLKISIPPENPVFSHTILKGYHYFTDIYFSLFSTITGIGTINLAINLIPIIIGLVFVLSNYLIAKTIFKKQIFVSLGTILLSTYSAQPYLFSTLFPNAVIHPAMFWLDQPATHIINPQLVLSIAAINLLIYFYINKKRASFSHIFLLTSMVGIKIYSLLAFLPTFFVELFKSKKVFQKYAYPMITILLVFGTALLIGNNSKQLPFFTSPGWFIKQMFTTPDHLNHDAWELRRLHYVEVGSIIHLIKHWSYGLIIFLIGNFGLILLPFTISIFKNKKKINSLLLPIIIASISFPLIFLQSGIVWNTIQTLTYARIPIIISVLFWLKKKANNFSLIVLSILILLSLPTIYLTYKSFTTPSLYQNFSTKLINSIKKIQPNPSNYYISSDKIINSKSLIPAISPINLYVADPTVLIILNLNKEKRLENIKQDIENNCLEKFIYLKYEDDQIVTGDCPQTTSIPNLKFF